MKTNLATIDRKTGEIAAFDPKVSARKIAAADTVIDFAKRVRDWPLLEKAVDEKLDEQEDFVEWWRAHVTTRHGAGRGNKKNSVPDSFSVEEVEKRYEIKQSQVSKWSTRLKKRDEYREQLLAAMRKAVLAEGGVGVLETLNTGDMEGYTPALYVEAARRVMGAINVDPASNDRAQAIVQADTYYTQKESGLDKPWRGAVFLNPPYNSGLIEKFIGKLFAEIEAGNTTAAVLLTNNNTDTRWFHDSAVLATAICLTKGRIKFYKPDSSEVSPTNGQAFFYFGSDLEAFKREFSPIGAVFVKA